MQIKLAIFITIFLAATLTHANNSKSICNEIQDTARVIMNARQNGALMSELLEAINQASDPKEDKELYKHLIITAFESPRYGSKEMKNRSIVDFQNDAHLTCIKRSM